MSAAAAFLILIAFVAAVAVASVLIVVAALAVYLWARKLWDAHCFRRDERRASWRLLELDARRAREDAEVAWLTEKWSL